jgi:drug/metabolite transporter (DMT)-like permease
VKKFYFIGFAILLFFDTLTQFGFKLAANGALPAAMSIEWIGRLLMQQWLYVAVVSYVGAFITYMTVLKHAPIGPAFAATNMQIVTVLIVSALFLKEHMTLWQVGGSLLILGGIICLALEKSKEDKDPFASGSAGVPPAQAS